MTSQPRRTTATTPLATPIAITGVACRLPGGVDSADALWELLRSGRDAVGEVPPGRWNADELAAVAGDASARPPRWVGGFLDGDPGAFDAEFFGISHEEARLLDPQHRMLLEVAWEACEHAGLPTSELAGSNTGVFAGMCNADHATYAPWLAGGGGPYHMTGNQFGTAAGRISHALGLRGPSMALDTACSSGLVAAHLACQSLQLGESDLALAGAANLLLSPRVFASYNELGVLSPSGRCKTFDREADGYVRAEGVVMLVLKRLDDARRDGDRVLAVLRGTAVNHDGKASRFTLPSGQAQEDVCRAALRRAGVEPAEVGMIEAHGTGTRAGDLVELASLAAVYGEGDGRCALGSVKTNLGHAEAAAGMVGLLKAVLAVQHGEVPGQLHFHRLPAEVEPSVGRLFVPTERTAWPVEDAPRIAAVCSYGFGGTNAHAIVEQAPVVLRAVPAPEAERRRTFLLSARSPEALEASAQRLAGWLTGSGAATPLDDVAHTLALRRSHGEERLAVLATSREDLALRLRGHAAGEAHREVVCDYVRDSAGAGPVWVFGGHGSQWAGMAKDLVEQDAGVARVVDEIDALVMAEAGFSPRDAAAVGRGRDARRQGPAADLHRAGRARDRAARPRRRAGRGRRAVRGRGRGRVRGGRARPRRRREGHLPAVTGLRRAGRGGHRRDGVGRAERGGGPRRARWHRRRGHRGVRRAAIDRDRGCDRQRPRAGRAVERRGHPGADGRRGLRVALRVDGSARRGAPGPARRHRAQAPDAALLLHGPRRPARGAGVRRGVLGGQHALPGAGDRRDDRALRGRLPAVLGALAAPGREVPRHRDAG